MKPSGSVRLACSTLVGATSMLLSSGIHAVAAEAPDGNPILAAPAATTKGPAATTTPRTISTETAARLSAAAPRYSPPAAPASGSEAAAEREDKPRNGIIRLPRYIVRQPKPPKLGDVQVLTPKGKLDLAMKTFPGLRFGSLGIFRNDAIASEMLEEELALRRKREATDLLSLLPRNGASSVDAGDRNQRQLIQDAAEPQSSWTNMTLDRAPGH